MIDPTINLGVIIQTIIVIGGGLVAVGAMRRTVSVVEKDIATINEDLKKLTQTIAQIAVQNERLNRAEEDIRDLRHGRGFVIDVTSGVAIPRSK